MIFSENNPSRPRRETALSVAEGRDQGAITVEYALCMVVAVVLMLGVEVMFSNMAQEIINRFKNIVLSFPNI